MNFYKTTTVSIFLSVLLLSLLHCSSVKKNKIQDALSYEDPAPITCQNPYFQKWVAGVKGGGSGINLYFPELIKPRNLELDSVFFRGMTAKLLKDHSEKTGYSASFRTSFNANRDIIMSSDAKAEYGNTKPMEIEEFPFDIPDNVCVLSYRDQAELKYVKIDGIIEKASLYLPQRAPATQNKD